jgi:hypothetical protein
MNYIKPEDIKEYVSKNPAGVAGMSKELSEMVNHFVELAVKECAHLVGGYTKENEFGTDVKEAYEDITKHFGVEE